MKYPFILSKFKQFKVPRCPEAPQALSQHQNEPRGQSALGLLAPRNLAAWLAKPSDLASLGREGTPDNYQNPKTAHTLQQGYVPLCTLMQSLEGKKINSSKLKIKGLSKLVRLHFSTMFQW